MFTNINKVRCRKANWMKDIVWKWHYVFTSAFLTVPTYKYTVVRHSFNAVSSNAANRRSACSNIHMPSDRL